MKDIKTDQVIKNNLAPSHDQLIRAKRFFVWYCIVSVTFLIAAISNLLDYNNRKVIFFIDVAVFLLAINEAKHSRTRLKSIVQATKNKEVKKDKDNE
jgi:hypothetical protein